MIEQTLVLVKPDGVKRGLIGEIIKRFEQRGLKIVAMKMFHADDELAKAHYREDIEQRYGKEVREALTEYLKSVPVVAFVVEGVNSIAVVRKICGATYPGEADLGTIRGDFAHVSKVHANNVNKCHNLVHSSGSPEEAKLEIGLWFKKKEIYSYNLSHEEHIR